MAKRTYLGLFESEIFDLTYNEKHAVETLGEHNLLHSLSWSLNDEDYAACDVDKDKKDPCCAVPVDIGSVEDKPSSSRIVREIIYRHNNCHEFLLEYPEFADNFDSGRLDDTLKPELKMAFMLSKAKARRAKKDEEDSRSRPNVLVTMIKKDDEDAD